MIIKKIKDIGVKLLNYKINKIQSKINKPIKNFDDWISRSKDLISIWNFKEAESLLLSLENMEKQAFEKISSDASLSSEFIEKFHKESEKKQKRIENLLNIIKSKKLWVAFTNIDNFWYLDAVKLIKKNIKEWNFVDARLFLMKLKQKEKNYFEILLNKNSKNYFKKIKYTYIYREKLENFIDLDISIFYNENFSKINKFSNLKSLIKILKIIIDHKDWDFFDKIIPEIKSFEENILSEIQNNSYLSYFYKNKTKKRYSLILKILNKLYKVYYKEKTWLSIELSQVKTIDDTFIVISDFLRAYNFESAFKALYELKDKETSFFEWVLWDQSIDQKFKNRLLKRFRKFENRIKWIENEINNKKKVYDKKAHIADLKIKNNQLNKQLQVFLDQKDFENALELINGYKKSLWDDLDKYIISLEKWKFKILKLKEKNINSKKNRKSVLEQARNLIWENLDEEEYSENNIDVENYEFLWKIKWIYKKYKFFKKQRDEKFLLANIESLLGNSKNIKESIIKQKLEKIHSWLVKDTGWLEMNWYSIFWKTLGSDNISWDTFGFFDYKNWKRFFIWDATGHWIKAWFMISLLTSNFYNMVSKFSSLKDLVVTLNNQLKQDLKSWNFITSIFFDLSYDDKDKINFIWMWHEPMFVYKSNESSIEKIFPGWIAAWMTILKEQAFLKEKELIMKDWDLLLVYTDWIVESRSKSWEMYSINRLQEKFLEACRTLTEAKEIYNFIYKDLSDFTEWSKFFDDVTIIVIKRDKKRDSIEEEVVIENILKSEKLSKKYIRNLKWKSKDDIEKFLKAKRKERELDSILKNLKNTFKSWDLIVLKKECQRYIKEWFIHKDIVKYLSYSIDNEAWVKINQQNMRLQNKYETLEKLLKNWQYKTVLEECSAIILNDWKI